MPSLEQAVTLSPEGKAAGPPVNHKDKVCELVTEMRVRMEEQAAQACQGLPCQILERHEVPVGQASGAVSGVYQPGLYAPPGAGGRLRAPGLALSTPL